MFAVWGRVRGERYLIDLISKSSKTSLSPIVSSYSVTLQRNRYLQVLRNSVALNLYLGLFALCQKVLHSAKKPRYEFSVTVLHRTYK